MTFTDYYQIIKRKLGIVARGNYTDSGLEGGKVYISFMLNSRGELKGNPKVLHADNSRLSDLAIKSLNESYPFPAFPRSVKEPEKTFRILISFE